MQMVKSVTWWFILSTVASAGDLPTYRPTAQEIRDTWILDGEVQMTVRGERELALALAPDAQFTLWAPQVFDGALEVSFEAFVPQDETKLLLMLYGHGLGDKPIGAWKRTAAYDDYNSGPMEVYTLAFNRGPNTATRPGDQFANVRRIGGPRFDFYTEGKRKAMSRPEQDAAWERWNTLSFLGGAREPVSGPGRWIGYRVVCNPPHVRMACDGVEFLELVDHIPDPLRKGAVGFRCMSRGKSLVLRNVVIKGRGATQKAAQAPTRGNLIYTQDFDALADGEGLPDGWWVEGTEKVWIEQGRLHMRANPAGEIAGDRANIGGFAGTVWTDCILSGNVRVEMDARVVGSHQGVNNINLLLFYSDPSGKPLDETRAARASGDYRLYHDLNGYIVTFLQDWPDQRQLDPEGKPFARVRLRRCPGFQLISEQHGYQCRENVTYHLTFTKQAGKLTFAVDGNILAEAVDATPLAEGRLGLRTYRTELWWDNLKVTRLTP